MLHYALRMILSDALTWVIDNKEWIFGGIGVAAIGWLFALFIRRQDGLSQRQRSGANSTNLQSGRDINLNREASRSDDER
jgi:hypothetical protein